MMLSPRDIGFRATLACILEAGARKPGNAYPGHDLPNLSYLELVASATAIGQIFSDASSHTVGSLVLAAIRATRAVVSTNTNLGTVLLLAPLALCECREDGLRDVLANLTVDDSINVYEAIRLAKPGGLGTVAEQDIGEPPAQPLHEVMGLAANRDLIARQYCTNFAMVFAGARRLGESTLPLEAAIIDLHLHLLAERPDSLIARKRGIEEAKIASRLAQAAIDRPDQLCALTDWFAGSPAGRNPGTTADLVAGCLFVALTTGIIGLPINRPWAADIP